MPKKPNSNAEKPPRPINTSTTTQDDYAILDANIKSVAGDDYAILETDILTVATPDVFVFLLNLEALDPAFNISLDERQEHHDAIIENVEDILKKCSPEHIGKVRKWLGQKCYTRNIQLPFYKPESVAACEEATLAKKGNCEIALKPSDTRSEHAKCGAVENDTVNQTGCKMFEKELNQIITVMSENVQTEINKLLNVREKLSREAVVIEDLPTYVRNMKTLLKRVQTLSVSLESLVCSTVSSDKHPASDTKVTNQSKPPKDAKTIKQPTMFGKPNFALQTPTSTDAWKNTDLSC